MEKNNQKPQQHCHSFALNLSIKFIKDKKDQLEETRMTIKIITSSTNRKPFNNNKWKL